MGSMFRGQFEHAIDAKGRTSLPARFRDVLSADSDLRLVMTPALFDPCLKVYPMKVWEQLEEKIAALPEFDSEAVYLRRRFVSAAVECELDKQGRVLVPPNLREYAALDKDVLWAGMGHTCELWSLERWASVLVISPEETEAFKKAIAERIRL